MKRFGLSLIIRKAYSRIALVVMLLTFIGLSIVNNYGISSDEKVHISNVFWNVDLVKKNKPIPANLRYFGFIFDFTSEVVFKAKSSITHRLIGSVTYDPKGVKKEKFDDLFYERIRLKHKLTFLLSLAAYISVAGFVGVLAGMEYAWLGPLMLALFPRFWGHSFFNPKDIPFASMFTLGSFLGALLVGYYQRISQEEIDFGLNRLTLYSLLYGILVGLVTGIRVGGCFLLLFIIATHLIANVRTRGSCWLPVRFWSLYLLMGIAWAVTTTIIHPASWSNPASWFFETLRYLSAHPINFNVLFEGQHIRIHDLPWYYFPKWLFITIPEVFQVLFFVGLLLIFYRFKKLTNLQFACVVFILLQLLFLPSVAILKHSSMYDGMRHFLFVIPSIATISTAGLIWIYRSFIRMAFRVIYGCIMVSLFIPIAYDMITLHPYEYIYFNRLAGGLKHARGLYETDYWGLSMREGMEWINSNAEPNSTVVSSGKLHSSKTFAAPGINVISTGDIQPERTSDPFYYIARPRWTYQEKFPECRIAYKVVRQSVPLTIVKRCDGKVSE